MVVGVPSEWYRFLAFCETHHYYCSLGWNVSQPPPVHPFSLLRRDGQGRFHHSHVSMIPGLDSGGGSSLLLKEGGSPLSPTQLLDLKVVTDRHYSTVR